MDQVFIFWKTFVYLPLVTVFSFVQWISSGLFYYGNIFIEVQVEYHTRVLLCHYANHFIDNINSWKANKLFPLFFFSKLNSQLKFCRLAFSVIDCFTVGVNINPLMWEKWMRRSTRNFNIPQLDLLPPPPRATNALPYRWICRSNARSKEHFSFAPVLLVYKHVNTFRDPLFDDDVFTRLGLVKRCNFNIETIKND